MRENDDDAPGGSGGGSLAEGLGETSGGGGGYSTTTEPYGDVDDGFGDTYGDDYDDDSYGDRSTSGDDDVDLDVDDTSDVDVETDLDDDGGFGVGEVIDGGTGGEAADEAADGGPDLEDPDLDDTGVDDSGVDDPFGSDGAEAASPLEGIGFLLDQVREALFGEDDAAAGAFQPDPAELASDTDLDLTGDGLVDGADLHEAASPLDFDVDGA